MPFPGVQIPSLSTYNNSFSVVSSVNTLTILFALLWSGLGAELRASTPTQSPEAAPTFDVLFQDQPLVLQANFGATNPPAANPTPASPPPVALRHEFYARLFGTADAKTKPVLIFEQPTVDSNPISGVELRLSGNSNPEKIWPVKVTLTPNANKFWWWEGAFSVPEDLKNKIIHVSVHFEKGPSLTVTLGTVWIMAGSPNLAVPSKVGPLPAGVKIYEFRGGTTFTVEQASSPPGTPFSGQLLPTYLAVRLAKSLQRPVALYVLSQAQKLLRDWELVSEPAGRFRLDNPFWNGLRGDAGTQNPIAGQADPMTIGARGVVWWHGEWQAEQYPKLDAKSQAGTFADFQEKYASDLASAKTSPGGLLVDVATFLTTGLRQDGKERPDPIAAAMFSRIVVQIGGTSQQGDVAARFPFGQPLITGKLDDDSKAVWQTYQMPDSTWARLRAAQTQAVGFLRRQGLEAILVPSLPTKAQPDLPIARIWAPENALGYAELADRVANAAVLSMAHSENLIDGQNPLDPQDLPTPNVQPGSPIITVTLSQAPDGPLTDGTATVEVHYHGDPPDRWWTKDLPCVQNHALTFTSTRPQGTPKIPLDGLRYAWGDAPGNLCTYTPEKGSPSTPPFILSPMFEFKP